MKRKPNEIIPTGQFHPNEVEKQAKTTRGYYWKADLGAKNTEEEEITSNVRPVAVLGLERRLPLERQVRDF